MVMSTHCNVGNMAVEENNCIRYAATVERTYSCYWTFQNLNSILANGRCRSKVFELFPQSLQWEIEYDDNEVIIFKLHCKPSRTGARADLVRFTAYINSSKGRYDERYEGYYGKWQEVSSVTGDPIILLEIGLGHFLSFLKVDDDMHLIHLEASYKFFEAMRNDGEDPTCDNSNLTRDFRSLYETEKMTDAVLVVEDTEIGVHSVVLAARSKVFAAMFENDFLEGQSRRIEISDFTPDTIKSMLKFLYCSLVDDFDVEKALDLLRAAKKYDVPDLTTCCSNFLLDMIDDENATPILDSAVMFNVSDLKEGVLDYLVKKRSPVSTDERESLVTTRPGVLHGIMDGLRKLWG